LWAFCAEGIILQREEGKTLGVPVALIDVGRPRERPGSGIIHRVRDLALIRSGAEFLVFGRCLIDDEIRTGKHLMLRTAELGKINDLRE
jgi:hypothetical protein